MTASDVDLSAGETSASVAAFLAARSAADIHANAASVGDMFPRASAASFLRDLLLICGYAGLRDLYNECRECLFFHW